MKIGIIGTGYVGLPTGVGLATRLFVLIGSRVKSRLCNQEN